MPIYPRTAPGPFRADQIRDGDPYELSNGHAIVCLPGGHRHGNAQSEGSRVLASDPAARGRVGVEVGVAWNDDKNLRAPDIIVADVERAPGWLRSVPPLAVEYADTGQDEAELTAKIAELHAGGTRFVWVVRLTGPLRVDVHNRDEPMRTVGADAELFAPGVLQNPVPVRALVDPTAADAASLRNLLSAYGYQSIAEIRAEGEAKGKAEGRAEGQAEGRAASVLAILDARGIVVTPEQSAAILECRDSARLAGWVRRALTVLSAAELLG